MSSFPCGRDAHMSGPHSDGPKRPVTSSKCTVRGWRFRKRLSHERFAATVRDRDPAHRSIELVGLVSSGTEAAMSAIRVARGATGRPLLVKFDGCYHGHADSLLVKAGSGGATFSIPDSGGVPAPLAALTLSAPLTT